MTTGSTLELREDLILALPLGERVWMVLEAMIVPIFLACIPGILLARSIGDEPGLVVGVLIWIFGMLGKLIRYGRLRINLEKGSISHTQTSFLWFVELSDWYHDLGPDDVAELHLHWGVWYSTRGHLSAALYVLTTTGERLKLAHQQNETDEQFRALAERIADATDTSIVEVEGANPPPRNLPS